MASIKKLMFLIAFFLVFLLPNAMSYSFVNIPKGSNLIFTLKFKNMGSTGQENWGFDINACKVSNQNPDSKSMCVSILIPPKTPVTPGCTQNVAGETKILLQQDCYCSVSSDKDSISTGIFSSGATITVTCNINSNVAWGSETGNQQEIMFWADAENNAKSLFTREPASVGALINAAPTGLKLNVNPMIDISGKLLKDLPNEQPNYVRVDGKSSIETDTNGNIIFYLDQVSPTIGVSPTNTNRPFSHFYDSDCDPNNQGKILDTSDNPYTFTIQREKVITPFYKSFTRLNVIYDGSTISGSLKDEFGKSLVPGGGFHETCENPSNPNKPITENREVSLYYKKGGAWYPITTLSNIAGSFTYNWQCIPGVSKIKAVYTPTSWYYVGNETDIDVKCDLSAQVRVCDGENCDYPPRGGVVISGYYQTTCKDDACVPIYYYPQPPTFECKEPIGVDVRLKNSGDYSLNNVDTDLEFLVVNDNDGSISRIEKFSDHLSSLSPGMETPLFHSVSSSHFADMKDDQHLGFKINVKVNGVDFISVDDQSTMPPPRISHSSIYSVSASPQMEFWCDRKCELNKLCNCTGIYRHPDNLQGDIQFIYRTDLIDSNSITRYGGLWCAGSVSDISPPGSSYNYRAYDCKVNPGDTVKIQFNPKVSGSILSISARVFDNSKDKYYSSDNHCEYNFYPENRGQCNNIQGLVPGQNQLTPSYELINCPNETRTIEVSVTNDKPDLVISDILSTDNKIMYEIANRGTAGAFPSISKIYINGNPFDSSVGLLLPGGTAWTFSGISWRKYCTSPSDTVNVQVCADFLSYVPEANEDNNCLTKGLGCCESSSAREICDNFVDDNCNGKIDCADPDCAGAITPLGTCCQAQSDCIATDNDGGIDEFSRGICTPSSCMNNVCRAGTQAIDTCSNAKTLLEYYTSDNQCLNTQINCPDNFNCSDGRCVPFVPPPVDCSVSCSDPSCKGKTGPFGLTCCQSPTDCSAVDTDGGKDPSKQGTCIPYTCNDIGGGKGKACQPSLGGQSTDNCNPTTNTLTEYYPSGNSCPSTSITCTNGICSEGRCISCQGQVELNLIPSEVLNTNPTSNFYASGLSGCVGERVYFRLNSCSGTDMGYCDIGSDGHGCGKPFNSGSSPGTYTYFACVDENGDENYGPDEQASADLKVKVQTACVYKLILNPSDDSSNTGTYSKTITATDSSSGCTTPINYNVQYSTDGDCSVSVDKNSFQGSSSFNLNIQMTGNRPCTVELRIIAPNGVWVAVGKYKVFKREVCNDGIDNDGNGKIDCYDTSNCRGNEGPGALCCQENSDCPAKDSDDNDEYTKGTCIKYNCLGYGCAVDNVFVDECKDTTNVYEYVVNQANQNSCTKQSIPCPPNYQCYDGKCIPVQIPPVDCSVSCSPQECRGQVGPGGSTCCQDKTDCTARGDAYNIFDKGNCQPFECQSNYCVEDESLKIDKCSGSNLIEYNPSGYDCLPGDSAPITCPTGYSCSDGRCVLTSIPPVDCSASCADPSCLGQAGPNGNICCQSPSDCSAYDTDSGNNPGLRGRCRSYSCSAISQGGKACIEDSSFNLDECITPYPNTLKEYYPSGNTCPFDTVTCTNGICYDGKCISTPPVTCQGDISLTLIPDTIYTGGNVVPDASNLISCQGKTVYFKDGPCSTVNTKLSCTIGSGGDGCMPKNPSSFSAPGSVGTYTYYACVDKNDNSNFNDAGESDSANLNVVTSSEQNPIYSLTINPVEDTKVVAPQSLPIYVWEPTATDQSQHAGSAVTYFIWFDRGECHVDSIVTPKGGSQPATYIQMSLGATTQPIDVKVKQNTIGMPCKVLLKLSDASGHVQAHGEYNLCSPENTSTKSDACADGVDNDCDGIIDCADPDCAGAKGGINPSTGLPYCCSIDSDCGQTDSCSDPITDTSGGGICTQTHYYCDPTHTCKSTQLSYADTCEGGDRDNPSVTYYNCNAANQCVGSTTTNSDCCLGTACPTNAVDWDCETQANGAGKLVSSTTSNPGPSCTGQVDSQYSSVKNYVCTATDGTVNDALVSQDTDCVDAGHCNCVGGACVDCGTGYYCDKVNYQCIQETLPDCSPSCEGIGLLPTKGTCRADSQSCWQHSEVDVSDLTSHACTGLTPRCCCLLPCDQISSGWWCAFNGCGYANECDFPYSQYKPLVKNMTLRPPVNFYNSFNVEYFNVFCGRERDVTINMIPSPGSNTFDMKVICDSSDSTSGGEWSDADVDCSPGLPGDATETCSCNGMPSGTHTLIAVENKSSTGGYYNLSVNCQGGGASSLVKIAVPFEQTTTPMATTLPSETTTIQIQTTTTTPSLQTVQYGIVQILKRMLGLPT
jgi:hypothetical protein